MNFRFLNNKPLPIAPIKADEKETLRNESLMTAESPSVCADTPKLKISDIAELIKSEKVNERMRYERVKVLLSNLKDCCKELECELDNNPHTFLIDSVMGMENDSLENKRASDVEMGRSVCKRKGKKKSGKKMRRVIEASKNTRTGVCAPCYIF